MATLTIGGKTVFTQSGTDEPVLSSDITGTLGSGIVFPAGHIIQTTFRKYNGNNSAAITSSTPAIALSYTGVAEFYGTISNLTSGNHVLVQMSFPAYAYRNNKLAGCNFQIFRDSVSNLIYGNMPASGNKRTLFQYTEGSVSEVVAASLITLSYIDESPTANSHTYYLGATTDTSATVYFYTEGANEFNCMLMEIAQ